VVIQHTAHSATMRAFLVWPSAAVDRKSASSVNSPNTADSTNSVAPHPFHRSACPSRVHQKGTKDAFGLRDHECHHWRNRTQMETRASKQRWSSPCALRSRRQMTFIDSQMSWWRFRETCSLPRHNQQSLVYARREGLFPQLNQSYTSLDGFFGRFLQARAERPRIREDRRCKEVEKYRGFSPSSCEPL
jgi:hypothetical protein